MLWVKAFHIVFVVSMFAGVFYLPRIFVNLAMAPADSAPERARLLLMARKLYRFTHILGGVALLLGFVLYLGYGIGRGPGNGWMHAKLGLVVLLYGYLGWCGALLKGFERDQAGGGSPASGRRRSHVWYRWFNEAPVLLLLAIVVLVVVKPF
jgi:protoporphyrinogen IX oxidase